MGIEDRLRRLEREAAGAALLADPMRAVEVAQRLAELRASVPDVDAREQGAREARVEKLADALDSGDLSQLDLTTDVDELFPALAPSPTLGQDLARRVHSLVT